MLTAGRRQGNLAPALRHAAGTYRRKAEARAALLRSALPTVLLLAIGAVAVLLYALMLFLPLTSLWDELAFPVNQ
jgi:type II secretory pathway component PulF